MDRPTIGTGGGNPTNDGDVNLYISPEAEAKSRFNRSRRIVFVNGMMNEPSGHASNARALSLLQACPVVGIFNKSDGLWPDLGQCIKDKATLVTVQTEVGTDFRGWSTAINGAFELARRLAPSLTKTDFIGSLISSNAATFAVYRYVVTLGAEERAA
jgi:hypothetical protein